MEALENGTQVVKDVISSDIFIALVLFVSLYFSIRMIFPQFRLFGSALKALSDSSDDKKGISPFQAFMTALGSRVGVGNVAGVATAIATGGPGAIAWIWIFGLLGSAIAIVEAVLGQAYKIKDGDEYYGGPCYYIMRGIKNKKIAKPFAYIFASIAVLGMGVLLPGVQSNTVVNSIQQGFGTDRFITVVVAAIVIALIIWGGIKRIGKIEGVLTPLKCIVYIAFAVVVIVYYKDYIGTAFNAIISSAFGLNPLFGGILGSAVGMGVRRGIFSTDVGYGPGGTFAAAARCEHPVKQGLLQGLSVLLSTLVICTATALVIILSGTCTVVDSGGNIIFPGVEFVGGIEAGAGWVQAGLDTCPVLHGWAPQILAVMIAIFATGTIVGYYYLIESNLRFLIGRTSKTALSIIKIIFLITLVASTMMESNFIWNTADIGMGLMGWMNLIVLMILSPKAISIVKDYSKALKDGIKPTFDPDKYGIDDDTCAWDLK
ncbi:MAG: alanine/glycine:cation symporter family protein [Coriobacteriia bacterium]|nr:alanine/glycine:cation symporter family protein [Coriobacteriia bacterium]